jgi:hypothetical protein
MFTEILLQARERSLSPANPPRSASQILFESIRNANIDPNWADLVLPSGTANLWISKPCDPVVFVPFGA